jgi:aspartyl-tRNA(Asn)/glutamyl-tRNA(Gln) amidotransferase subunit A
VSIPDATLHLSLAELSERVRTRRLDPVELAEAYMDRLQRLGPDLGALVTVTRERGLAEARQARDEIAAGRWRGPLHGVPYGAKDLIGADGYPTTWGAQPYREQRLPDAAVVERLKAAGAVLVAKLASVELAGGFGYEQADASFTGPGRTPWNRDYWSGGSSSGPGAAVAAALVPFAIGSETWGSIFAPAALSGVTGLRPTYGRVSRWGAMALSWTMDKIGPMCRTAEDCGLVLEAIAGPDPRDESAQPRPYRHATDAVMPRRPRLGVLKGNAEGSQAEVRRNFEASLEVLSQFADLVRDVELPEYPYGAAASMIIDAEAASIFEELVSSGRVRELSAPEDRIGGYAGQVVLAKDYLRAMRIRRPAGEAMDPDVRGGRIRRAGASDLVHRVVSRGQALRRGVHGPHGRRRGDQRRGEPRRPSGDRAPQRLRAREPADEHRVHGARVDGGAADRHRARGAAAHGLAPPHPSGLLNVERMVSRGPDAVR